MKPKIMDVSATTPMTITNPDLFSEADSEAESESDDSDFSDCDESRGRFFVSNIKPPRPL